MTEWDDETPTLKIVRQSMAELIEEGRRMAEGTLELACVVVEEDEA